MVIAPDAALPRVQLKTQLTSKHHYKLPISSSAAVIQVLTIQEKTTKC